jgi:hypothetical protein
MTIDETPITRHVHQCVKMLNEYLQNRSRHLVQEELQEDVDSFEALFELVDMPWDEGSEKDVDFREGYETAVLDMVEAIAHVWGVELPNWVRPG